MPLFAHFPSSRAFHPPALFVVALSLFPLALSRLSAAELALTRDREPTAQIQLAPHPSTTEQYAAEELQRAIERISGARLPIASESTADKGAARIIIGTPKTNPEIKAALERRGGEAGKGDEAITLWRDGETLYLAGPTPRAALYATYTFLQETLGARWLWPGEGGEFFPQQASIAIDTLDLRHAPSIPYRSLSVNNLANGYDLDTDIWMARNRMNLQAVGPKVPLPLLEERKKRGFLIRVAGHNVKLPKETLAAHPEYAAYFGGKRRLDTRVPPQLCWSNPAVVDLIAQEVSKWWEISPLIDFAAPYSADNGHFCECEPCLAMGDVSTRWQKFSKLVIAKIDEKHPGKRYMTLAYQAYRNVPKSAKGELAPYVNNGYCVYNGCYRHTYSDPCEANPEALKEITAWQELGGQMGIRGYEIILFREPMFVPYVSFMVDQARWGREHNLVSIMTESAPYNYPPERPAQEQQWASKRMSYYATAQAMWNADIQPETIVDEWNRAVFGPAASAMSDYYWAMERAWRATPGHITYLLNPAASYADGFITPKLIEKVEGLFAVAREKGGTATDPAERSRIAKEIAFEHRLFEKWKHLHEVHQGRAEHYQAFALKTAQKPALSADADEALWAKAGTLPAFEDLKGKQVTDNTEVKLLWDDEALYLRFICHDSSGEPPVTKFTHRDESIYSDDSIELFFQPKASEPAYIHMAVNSAGAQNDSRSSAGMNLDRSWNGAWTTAARVGEKGWIVDVALPFAVFEISPKQGEDLLLNFTRTRPGKRPDFPPSGWPDASYHNPSGYGKIRLALHAPKPVAVFSGPFKAEALLNALQSHELIPTPAPNQESLTQAIDEGCQGIVLRYPWATGEKLSRQFLKTTLQRYVVDGGQLLITSRGNIPLHDWFPGEGLAVEWEDAPFNPVRRTRHTAEGAWLTTPNDLRPIFKKGTTPRNSYRPLTTGWEVLATMQLMDNEESPFLLRRQVGKGQLYLTSSVLGLSGRHEIFGNANPLNAAMLVENLFRSH